MKKTVLIFTIAIFGGSLMAQNFSDALRFSEMETQGTARFNAMGGSFGALGGEISGLSKNPAGIGIYRNSEFTFSTGFNIYDSESRYRGNLTGDGRINFNIPNIGYVGTYKGDQNGWKNYSFGITYNRVSSFNQETRVRGNTDGSSIIDDYVNILNRNNANVADVEEFGYPFGASEAWNIFMIDIDTNGFYVPWVEGVDNIEQSKNVTTTGNQSETAFTFGGNFQDKLYLGGGIGFQRVRFNREVNFTENYTYDRNFVQTKLPAAKYSEEYSILTLGNGINVKIGGMYRINDMFRLGAAYHSPTFFGFSEEFTFESDSRFTNGAAEESGESISNYDYQLRTPGRYIGSLAYLYKQAVAINVEYEFVNYENARLDDSQGSEFDYSDRNQEIKDILKSTHNFRAGAEINGEPFVGRFGVRYDANPFKSDLAFSPDEDRITYSIGGGFRSKNYNIDIAYSTFSRTSLDQPYQTSSEIATIEEREHNLMFTVGWRW